jgi:hypothetical protein
MGSRGIDARIPNLGPARYRQGEKVPSTHWVGRWVSHRASLDAAEKIKNLLPLPKIEPRFIYRPIRCLVAMPTILSWLF